MKFKSVTLTYTDKSEFNLKVEEIKKSTLFEYCYNNTPSRFTFKVADPDSDIRFLHVEYFSLLELHFNPHIL